MLSLSRLQVFHGRAQVLFDLSFSLKRGEVVALVGRNGVGKSTTLKAIMGLLPAAGGEIAFESRPITRLAPDVIARLGIGYVPEERRIFRDLTVRENLEVGRRPRREGAPFWDEEKLFALFPNLAELRSRRGSEMSGGEQQMLTLARSLMGNPKLLLLDEPSEGLAPLIVQQMAASLGALKAEGLTLLISEQNLRFAGALADRSLRLERGRIEEESAGPQGG